MSKRGVFFCLLLSLARPLPAQDGAALYKKHCASCHDAGAARVPPRSTLEQLSPERILLALESGSMVFQGAHRSDAERRAIAAFLAGKPARSEPATSAPSQASLCRPESASFREPFGGPHWNGWGVDLSNSRFQDAKMAGLTAG